MSGLEENDINSIIKERRITNHTDVISKRISLRDIREKVDVANEAYDSLQQLIDSNLSKEKVLETAVYLRPTKINNTENLKDLIVNSIPANGSLSTPIRKLIKYYDWLKYGLNRP